MKKLQATEDMIKKVTESVYAVLKSLESEGDLRKTLPLLSDVSDRLRAIAEIYDTPENEFISYLIWDQVRYLGQFEGLPDEWYKLNAEAIVRLKLLMKTFFQNLKNDCEKKDADKIVEHVKDLWYESSKIRTSVTRVKK